MSKKNKFNWRGFVSLYIALSFLIMTISGIILYIAPPGRVAHWSYWGLLGLTKTEWQAIHTIFTFIFVGFLGFHIFFNWKPLIHYLKSKTKTGLKLRKELSLAIIISFIIFGFTYFQVPPFSTVMVIGEEITDSWSTEENEPPIPHAELLTVTKFAETIKIPFEEFKNLLSEKGYIVTDTSMTIEKLAAIYKVKPSKIYNDIKVNDKVSNSASTVVTKYVEGSGYGRKKISDIFKENNLSWEEGVKLFESAGIELKNDDKLKNIADDNNKIPIDLIKIIHKDI